MIIKSRALYGWNPCAGDFIYFDWKPVNCFIKTRKREKGKGAGFYSCFATIITFFLLLIFVINIMYKICPFIFIYK